MNTLTNFIVPNWISIAFLAVIFIPSIMLAFLAKQGLQNRNSVFYSVIMFFALYFTYVTIASLNGLFNRVFLPPIVLLYCTFPFAIFLFTVVINLKIYREFLENIALENLVAVHIFRLIGVFFLLLAFHEALPKFFAIIAGLGDIITAITSIFMAKAINHQHPHAKTLALLWNTFGLMDIIFTAFTAIVLTKLSIDHGTMGVDTLARFPFCLIPAFAPPIIIFLHIAYFQENQKNFCLKTFSCPMAR